jgi:glycosyltransferase involved in cell wall biosynthesis
MSATPRVDVGLPVRNGERYLPRQLDSLLAQDFEDFRVIISDNASTDRTQEICRRYAERDPRIEYHRSDVNRGLAWNWNRAFELSRAPYFKWAAHDDEHEPTFLSRCVAVLDADSSVVCCHAETVEIDEDSVPLRRWPARSRLPSDRPHARLAGVLRPYPCPVFEMFGVMRADALRRTRLHGAYPESDHVLLAELALLGRIVVVPEPLFRRRDHAGRSVRALPDPRTRWAFFTGNESAAVSDYLWRVSRELTLSVRRSPVRGTERLRSWREVHGWIMREAVIPKLRSVPGRAVRKAGMIAGRRRVETERTAP